MKNLVFCLVIGVTLSSCDTRMTWRTYERRCVKIVSDYNSMSRAREMCKCEVEKLKEADYTSEQALDISTENIRRVEALIKEC